MRDDRSVVCAVTPRRMVVTALLVLFSAGWLVPVFLAGYFFSAWIEHDVAPRLFGLMPTTGFPYLAAADRAFWAGFSWLAAVVLMWSVVLSIRVTEPSAAIGSPRRDQA